MKKLTTLTTLIALAAALSAPAWAATKTVTLSVPGTHHWLAVGGQVQASCDRVCPDAT